MNVKKNSAQRTKKKNAHVGDMHSQTVTQISPASAWCNHQRKHQRAMHKNATHCPSLSSSSSRLHRQTSIRASSSSDSPDDGYDEDGEEKLVVPPNLFPGFETPEKKAASSLVTLMTMAACRVVLDQWCGSRHRSPMYNKLIDYMQKGAPHTNNEPRPIRDGNQWLHELMRHPELDFRLAAVRILETRKLLVDKEFNWEVMDANAREGIRAESIELNKLYLNMLCAEKDECEDCHRELCALSIELPLAGAARVLARKFQRTVTSQIPHFLSTIIKMTGSGQQHRNNGGGVAAAEASGDNLMLTESELQIIHAFRSRPRAIHLTNSFIDFSQKLSPVAAYISHQMAMTMSQVTRTTWFISRYWWLRHSRRRHGPVVASLAIAGVLMQRKVERGVGVGVGVPLSPSSQAGLEIGKGVRVFLRMARKLSTPDPLPEFTGSIILFVAAFAPHKALIRRFLKLAAKVCKIPRIRKLLQKNGKKLAKLLAQNKAKNEVFSYRQALNEAWKELESSLAPDVLQSMRVAERRAAAIAHGAFEEDDADVLFFSEEKKDSEDEGDDDSDYKAARNSNRSNSSSSASNNDNSSNDWSKRNNKFGPKLPERRKKEKQQQHKRKPSTLQRVGSLVNVVTGGGKAKEDDGDGDGGEDDDNGSKVLVSFDAPQTPKSPRASRRRWFDSPSDAEDEDLDEDLDGIIRSRVERNIDKNNESKRAAKNKTDKSGSNGLKRNGVLSIVQRSVLHLVEDIRCFPQDAVDYVFLGDAGLPLAKLPKESDVERFIRAIDTEAKDCFTYVQLACFLMQRQNKIDIAAEAVERSAKWRSGYKFLDDRALKKFENVIFRHRRLPRGGSQVIFRLRAAHDMILKKSSMDSSLNLEMVVCAIVSVVEREWQKLRASGNGRLRGGIVCVVDCAGLDITALPISLVAATLRLLDANYPELAAEVHVTSVWWAAKRALKALLDGVSTSSRARVHIYKSGNSGTEKLLDHFARHQLPSCIAGGTCKCRRCKSLPTAHMFVAREGTWRDIPWGEMNASQRRQYVRHHFVYLIGLCAFYPMHFARMTAHPFLVSAVKLDSRMSRRTRIMVWRTVMSAIVLLVTFWIWQWMESNPTQVEIIRDDISSKVINLREKGKARIDDLQRKAVLARDRFKSTK